jgi:hypothetical protein
METAQVKMPKAGWHMHASCHTKEGGEHENGWPGGNGKWIGREDWCQRRIFPFPQFQFHPTLGGQSIFFPHFPKSTLFDARQKCRHRAVPAFLYMIFGQPPSCPEARWMSAFFSIYKFEGLLLPPSSFIASGEYLIWVPLHSCCPSVSVNKRLHLLP